MLSLQSVQQLCRRTIVATCLHHPTVIYRDPIWTTKTYAPWWRHQMEPFSALLALCAGNSPVPVNSPHKGQWHGALMFSLIYAWINDLVNNREAGDLRRQCGHYDVIAMQWHYELFNAMFIILYRLSRMVKPRYLNEYRTESRCYETIITIIRFQTVEFIVLLTDWLE